MNTSLENALKVNMENIIRKFPLGKTFDSHQFLFEFTHSCQKEYIEGLSEVKDKKGPFGIVNGLIAKYISEHSQCAQKSLDSNGKPKRVPSKTIFDTDGYNQEWVRVK